MLTGRGPWVAAAIAALFAVPNLLWDAAHGWPNLEMAKALSKAQGGALGSLQQLPTLLVILAGPLLVALWVIGIKWLISPAGREHRWLLAATVAAVLLFTISAAPYYAAPMLAALYAAGGVRVEEAATARGRIVWPLAIAVSFVAAVLIWLPVLPVRAASPMREVSPVLVETYGWPQFVDQVAAATATLPPDVPIFTSNYGEAGALSILGPAAGVDRPVFSGHNNYSLWGPPSGRPDTVVCRPFQVRLLATILGPGSADRHHHRAGRRRQRRDGRPRRDLPMPAAPRQLARTMAGSQAFRLSE